MENLVNQRVTQIEISGIRKFFNMVAGIEDMVSLSIGQPDFPTPGHVKEAAVRAINDNKTVYTHKLPNCSTLNSFDFALYLVKKARVAVVPGSAFSDFGEGYFRLSFAYSMERLKEGLDRLESYIM